MDLKEARIVIVGAGQAGARAAEALRAAGHHGPISLVGEEEHPPYERPQLSKAVLIDKEPNPTLIRQAQDWSDLEVALLTSSSVVAADAQRRVVALANGRELSFDRLLLATGTRVRRLAELDNGPLPVRYLRSLGDALALRPELKPGRRIALVGGGVVGLEVASAAIRRGCQVTIIEKADSLLPQIGSGSLADYLRSLHSSKGARIVCGAVAKRTISGGLELNDGRLIPADLALVGVGVEPVTELALQLGLDSRRGIRVTSTGATAIEGIFAAGDVAEQWSPGHDRWMRIENWANAQNQAIATARSMAGIETAYGAPPWFWSDQYDANIQIVGNPAGGDEIVRGDTTDGRFTVASVRDGEVVGGIAVNSARDMAVLRRLVASRKRVRKSDLENPAFELKRLLAA
ncbi:Anthranilate 1,2-dioxygenase system ferredoxin--NAD(+) reductase component [Bradyrhizobium ivorense]|uniref:Anthranilate 1,2-dioxygenase system ferredoxin--NAD(+) reductase component n=1 Tax=Bradyrhizobium ivorense TaxID=2511166 RepID=A0A508TFJ3_9BRAD|nr:FAD-dependent oxidoreductase [Bradyrhizobium ivorense]VIO67866.1 Anthranilate 1,2-dioxygenase system ferredoxin--NAD(+) reductase component [Bradyrhizobium ivorense]VIO73114.1 Anthranilate 1,2-dioxygenase system ferredoxin--NAD(+) reductase component [Bradyrhizobium ivorense]